MLDRRTFCEVAAGALALGACVAARAQAAAPATVKVIVVVPPGATMDIIARLVADRLRESLKRTVLVDYKPGGTGLVAAQFLKSTEPDGAHLMFAPMAVASFFPFLYSKLSFEPDHDLAPVCNGVQIPLALTASVGSNVQTLQQFLAQAKADPLRASIGTSSMSSVGAFIVLRLRQMAGIDLQLVPYKGGQPLLTDLLGNQIPAGVSVMSDYLAQHRAGRVRILATSGAKRSPLAPDLPTIAESGFPDLYGASSIGFFVRGGTPPALISHYATEINAILKMPDIRSRLAELGAEPVGGSTEEFRREIVTERARWSPVAREANIRIE